MTKESYLIGPEHFGLWIENQNFPFQKWGLHSKTEKCNVFHYRLLPAKRNDKILFKNKKNSILNPFCALFVDFKANKNFSGKSASVTFFYFYISDVQNFRKKLINRLQKKLVTDRHIDKHEFERPLLQGVQKACDSMNHNSLIAIFIKYGLDEIFIELIKIFLPNQESSLINGSFTTKYFKT